MSLTLSMQWQVFACAAFCACGATLGLITVLREISYHVIPLARGPAYAAAALCGGIVLGLWMPRRIIRRRLERGEHAAGRAPPTDLGNTGGVRTEFAASLAGGLIITFGLTWVVLCSGALFMEEYRALLARRFLHPVWLTHLLLSMPGYAGLAFAGATGTTLLVALHGWYRLITQPNTKIARLWTSILLGAAAAGLLAQWIASPTVFVWLAPLVVFVAGLISVWRRSDVIGVPTAQTAPHPLTRDELLALLAAGLAAAATGTALFLTIPSAGIESHDLGMGAAVLAAAACAGLLTARAVLRLRFSADLGSLALLACAVALLLPYTQLFAPSVNVGLVRLAAVTGCAAACVVLVGRRVSQTSRSMQYALSWVGRFVAGSFGLALALSPACVARWNPATLALIAALVATAGAGLVLILDSRPKTALRVAGLMCVALWLAGVPSATRATAEALRGDEPAWQHPAGGPLVDTIRRLVIADQFRAEVVRPLPLSPDASTTWHFDLAGPTLDVVALAGVARADDCPVSDAELGRRLLKRLTTRLAPGGRLLIELPTAPFVAAALPQFDPAASDPAWTGYRLRVRDKNDECAGLVFGADIPALIERHTPLPEIEVSLRPLGARTAARGRGPLRFDPQP